jgi:hypothetical protein
VVLGGPGDSAAADRGAADAAAGAAQLVESPAD